MRLALVTVVSMCVLGGCTSRTEPADSDEVTLTVTSVRLNVDGGGSVSIEGKDEVEQATVEVGYEGDEPSEDTYEVEDGLLTLNGCGPRCAANYEVTVPLDTPVTGRADNGAVELARVSGIDVTTDNGEVTLSRIETGDVTVRSRNGTIHGVGLHSDDITAETENGEIEIQVATPQNIAARTVNGSIDLIVPEGSYRVFVETVNGPTDIGVENNPEGRYDLDLRTRNGAISVATA